ncbi:MAG: polyphenol oxidase family protein, partial [Spirochaeta sp.]
QDIRPGDSFVQLEFPVPFYLSMAEAGDMGPSAIRSNRNREKLIAELGTVPERIALVEQKHTRTVIDRDDARYRSSIADGIVCYGGGNAGEGAGVTVADCMPIAVYEHTSSSWAVLHSGRRGTGILGEAVRCIRDKIGGYGRFSATLGPCISALNYQVDMATAHHFAREWGESSLVEYPDGYAIDLRAANLRIAQESEIDLVIVYDDCTYDDPRLGSYRFEGADKFTRMLALIVKE